MNIKALLGTIGVVALLLTGATYVWVKDGANGPEANECGEGNVSIYVNNIQESVRRLEQDFKEINWQITSQDKIVDYKTKLISKGPVVEIEKLNEIIRAQSTDSIVYGEKTLTLWREDEGLKDCKIYYTDITLTDVKALQK